MTVIHTIVQDDLDVMNDNHLTLYINNVVAQLGDNIDQYDSLKTIISGNYEYYNNGYHDGVRMSHSNGSSPISPPPDFIDFKTHDDGITSYVNNITSTKVGWVFYASVQEIQSKLVYTINQNDLDLFGVNDCELYINDVLAVLDSEINVGDKLVLTIVENFIFYPSDYDGVNYDGALIYKSGSGPLSSSSWVKFVIDDTNKNAVIESLDIDLEWDCFIISTIEDSTPDNETLASNNVYKIDNEILKGVVSERFTQLSGETVDKGQYILGVKQIPFNIPDELIINTESIKLGNSTLKTEAELLSSDRISFDLGFIEITSNKNNSLDWVGTEAILHLPYADKQTIDLEYVIDCEVGVIYSLDVYTGNFIINVTSIKDGVETVVQSLNVDIGSDVPFMGEYTGSEINNNSLSLGGDNTERFIYIELVKNVSDINESFFNVPVNDYGKLTDYVGYCEVNKINLVSGANSLEKEMIMSVLSNGVIIND